MSNTCLKCGLVFITKASNRGKLYCSPLCRSLAKKKPLEVLRAENAARVKDYYHRVLKQRPDFHKIVKEQNARYRAGMDARIVEELTELQKEGKVLDLDKGIITNP